MLSSAYDAMQMRRSRTRSRSPRTRRKARRGRPSGAAWSGERRRCISLVSDGISPVSRTYHSPCRYVRYVLIHADTEYPKYITCIYRVGRIKGRPLGYPGRPLIHRAHPAHLMRRNQVVSHSPMYHPRGHTYHAYSRVSDTAHTIRVDTT